MEIKFNVTGERRKALVMAAGQILDLEPVYKGAPTFAYAVGGFIIGKDGTLTFDNLASDPEQVEKLLDGLAQRGFHFETEGRLVIEFPRDGFSENALANLEKLIASKAALIKKAIGTDNLTIEQTETALRFPWFRFGASPEEVNAYSRFIGALCTAAKKQKRVTATEKQVGNEKYAFRCFLLRLGFIGGEYKTARKVLLAGLSGNSAFRSGVPNDSEVTADE